MEHAVLHFIGGGGTRFDKECEQDSWRRTRTAAHRAPGTGGASEKRKGARHRTSRGELNGVDDVAGGSRTAAEREEEGGSTVGRRSFDGGARGGGASSSWPRRNSKHSKTRVREREGELREKQEEGESSLVLYL